MNSDFSNVSRNKDYLKERISKIINKTSPELCRRVDLFVSWP